MRFFFSAVRLYHCRVHRVGISRVNAADRLGYFLRDVFGGFLSALAAVAFFVAVAEFESLKLARGSSRGSRTEAHAAVRQMNLRFNRGISAAVENFPPDNLFNAVIIHKIPPKIYFGGSVSLFWRIIHVRISCVAPKCLWEYYGLLTLPVNWNLS